MPKLSHETDLSNFDTTGMDFDDFNASFSGEEQAGDANARLNKHVSASTNSSHSAWSPASPLEEPDVDVWPIKNKDLD